MAISNLSSGFRPGVCTSTTRPTAPYEGQMIYETDTNLLLVYNGSAWVCITPQSATVATTQTTTSTSYTDLTTSGPAVTLATGTSALVTVAFQGYNSGAGYLSYMSVAVSGATTIAAADSTAAVVRYDNNISASATFLLTGLTAGSNTFTAKYKTSTAATTATFINRHLTVVGVP